MNYFSFMRGIGEKRLLAAICLLIFCGMAVAAFWPFNPRPRNHVAWLGNENGLRFGGGGIILGSGKLEFPESEMSGGASLEIWLEPAQDTDSTSLLSFSPPANPQQLRLRQAQSYLLILEEPTTTIRHSAMTSLWVPRAFQAHKKKFITVSSGVTGTTVYLDGVPAEKAARFKITGKDISGLLIAGCSPDGDDTWRGKLFGLAIFDRKITPAQVSRHYQGWLAGRLAAVRDDHPIGLFTFEERAGKLVRNRISSGPDLIIPGIFTIPYKPFLKAFWKEFYPNRAYLNDVLINVAGFVPFGFFFCMYLSSRQASRTIVVATILLGAAFSVTIEVLQWFIPMRDSGTTDILTNSLGTALGAMLYRSGTLHALFDRLASRTTA